MSNDVIYVRWTCNYLGVGCSGCSIGEMSDDYEDVSCHACDAEPVAYVPQAERDHLATENMRLRGILSRHGIDQVTGEYDVWCDEVVDYE